jgi:hypothetical protein
VNTEAEDTVGAVARQRLVKKKWGKLVCCSEKSSAQISEGAVITCISNL